MNKAEKQRLIKAVLDKSPNCTECGKLIKNYNFEYEPKNIPLDAPVVSKRADNGRKWVMCKECSNHQNILTNERVKNEAVAMIDGNCIKAPSIKQMSGDEIRSFLHKQNLAVNALLGRYSVPEDIISEVKKAIRSEFHIRYYLVKGVFLTEQIECN